jgi:hypothetical protein
MKRRSPLDPESSRTLVVLFLTYSPELALGSGVLAQSEHVFVLFSFILVQFSFNFFDFDTNFFGIQPFFNSRERLLNPRVFSSKKSALPAFWQEGFSFPRLVLCNLHPLFPKNAHYRDYHSCLTSFCSFDQDFISFCSLTKGCIGNFDWTGLLR